VSSFYRLIGRMVILLITIGAPDAQAADPVILEIQILIAECSGKPVQPSSWIESHRAAASQIFSVHGIRLLARQSRFTPSRCILLDRKDRDAIARHAPPDRLVVLVVERAQDLQLPSYNLMGVHWRYGGDEKRLRGRRYVILTARARPPVLAHELCHFLGLPHDPAGGNLMTPGPSDPVWRRPGPKPRPFTARLTPTQGAALRAAVVTWSRQTRRSHPSRR
jgi:hypothetical protein